MPKIIDHTSDIQQDNLATPELAEGYQRERQNYILATARDLTHLSLAELTTVFQEFQTSFPSMDDDLRFAQLEQFMSLDIATDQDVLTLLNSIHPVSHKYINNLSGEEPDFHDLYDQHLLTCKQRGTLGRFIYKNTKPSKFIKSFHACYHYMDTEDRMDATSKFTKTHPEHAMMVAPFVDLSRISIPLSKIPADQIDKFKDKKNTPPHTILDIYFNHLQEASLLLDTILEHDHDDNYFNNKYFVENIVRFYMKDNSAFLFPYLPQLLAKNYITTQTAHDILLSDYLTTRQFYKTAEDRLEWKEVLEKVEHLLDNKKPRRIYDFLDYQNYRFARYIDQKITKRVHTRALDHIFQSFSDVIHLLSTDEKYQLIDLFLANDLPVFSKIDEFGFTQTDIKMIINRDLDDAELFFRTNISDSIKALIDFGMEKYTMRIIIQTLQQAYNDSYAVQIIVDNIEELLMWFSPKNQQKIMRILSQRLSGACLDNLDFFVNKRGVSLTELIKNTQQDKYIFIEKYFDIFNFLSLAEQRGDDHGITKEEFRLIAKNIIKKNPHLIFSYKIIERSIMTSDELDTLIRGQISSMSDPRFIHDLIDDSQKDRFQKYLPLIKQNLIQEPANIIQFLVGNIDTYKSWSTLRRIIPRKQLLQIFFQHLDQIDLSTFLDNNEDFIQDIAKNKKYIYKFIDHIATTNDIASIYAFLDVLPNCITDREYLLPADIFEKLNTHRKSAYSITTLENIFYTIDRLREIIQQASTSQPFIIFDHDLIEFNEALSLDDTIDRYIDQYIQYNPTYLNHWHLTETIDHDKYNQLINDNIRQVAFIRNRHGVYLVDIDSDEIFPETKQRLTQLNPIMSLACTTERLPKDYYEMVLDQLRTNPLYPIYQKKLENIAKQELAKNGLRTDMEYFSPDKKFADLASQLFLLNSHIHITDNAEKILQLPDDIRLQLLKTLKIIMMYNLDNNLDLSQLSSHNATSIIDQLNKHLVKHLCTVFEIDQPNHINIHDLSVNSIHALITYYQNTCRKKPRLKKCFQDLMTQVISGNFTSWRMWGADHDFNSLLQDQLIPSGISMEQYQAWTHTDTIDLTETLELSTSDITSGIIHIMRQAVADQHIKDTDLPTSLETATNSLQLLTMPLQDWSKELKSLRKQTSVHDQQEKYKQLQINIAKYREEHQGEIALATAHVYLSKLRHLSLAELQRQELDIGKKQISFSKVFRTLEQAFQETHPDFVQDIHRIHTSIFDAQQKIFSGTQASKTDLSITDKLDLETHIHIGALPVESCQHFDSSSDLNRGLLSYSTDPNVKFIQVYNESGKIIARSALRLLEDDSTKPQLFLERIYSVNAHHLITDAILKFAKQKAAKLGVHLYSHISEGNQEFIDPDEPSAFAQLHSKNSRSAFVYTDAAGGMKKGGVYSFPASRIS